MRNRKFVMDWLRRARSHLERARLGRASDHILCEDLCFDCQQCAEKAIKALLIALDREFPRTHSIARLLEIAADADVEVPEEARKAAELTDYAVATRYPGVREPVTGDEYEDALGIAEVVYRWVTRILDAEKSRKTVKKRKVR